MNAMTNMQVKQLEQPTGSQVWNSRPQLGLALSGGGARGLAHIGVLEILEEQSCEVSSLSGASMGGVIAALYASGLCGSQLHQVANQLARPRELFKLLELRPGRRGLVSAAKLEQLLAGIIEPDLTFEELSLPLALSATDLQRGCRVILDSGPLLPAVMATCAFPGVFPPVELNGRSLVDGGVLNNLPVDLLNPDHSAILAVDVSPKPSIDNLDQPPNIIARMPAMAQVLYRSTMLMNQAVTQTILEERPPDLLIRPGIPSEIGVFDGFTRSEEIIQIGRQSMLAHMNELGPLMRD